MSWEYKACDVNKSNPARKLPGKRMIKYWQKKIIIPLLTHRREGGEFHAATKSNCPGALTCYIKTKKSMKISTSASKREHVF